MTLDNHNDASGQPDETNTQGDSALVQDLREQIKKHKEREAAQPKREELEAEIRTAILRDNAIEEQLVALGHPAGIKELVDSRLEGSEVTAEAVTKALTDIGYEVAASDDAAGDESASDDGDLKNVTQAAAAVQAAAQGGSETTTLDKINSAETPEELAQIVAEAGLTH